MKLHPVSLCLFVMAALLLTSCSDDDNGDGLLELDPGEFPLEEAMSGEIPVMSILIEEFEEELYNIISINVSEDHDEISLDINGNEVELQIFAGFYVAEDVDIVPEEEISFNLQIDGDSRSGELEIPALLHGEIPDEFDLNSDFIMEWTIADDPSLFVASLILEIQTDFEDFTNVLDGNERSHTFSQSLYSDVSEEDLTQVESVISAISYKVIDNMLFMAGSEKYRLYSGSTLGKMQEDEEDETSARYERRTRPLIQR